MTEGAPQVLVIGGANGAGKSTVAPFLMAELGIRTFLNADDMAREMNPANVAGAAVAAGRMMHARIEELRRRRESFAIETTLSGNWLRHAIGRLSGSGYEISLAFIWIPDAEIGVTRVRSRARQGGHFVPAPDVRRRHLRGIRNFDELYRGLSAAWRLYHGARTLFGGGLRLIARGSHDRILEVHDRRAWLSLRAQAHREPEED